MPDASPTSVTIQAFLNITSISPHPLPHPLTPLDEIFVDIGLHDLFLVMLGHSEGEWCSGE
jgi:hypothetical protein